MALDKGGGFNSNAMTYTAAELQKKKYVPPAVKPAAPLAPLTANQKAYLTNLAGGTGGNATWAKTELAKYGITYKPPAASTGSYVPTNYPKPPATKPAAPKPATSSLAGSRVGNTQRASSLAGSMKYNPTVQKTNAAAAAASQKVSKAVAPVKSAAFNAVVQGVHNIKNAAANAQRTTGINAGQVSSPRAANTVRAGQYAGVAANNKGVQTAAAAIAAARAKANQAYRNTAGKVYQNSEIGRALGNAAQSNEGIAMDIMTPYMSMNRLGSGEGNLLDVADVGLSALGIGGLVKGVGKGIGEIADAVKLLDEIDAAAAAAKVGKRPASKVSLSMEDVKKVLESDPNAKLASFEGEKVLIATNKRTGGTGAAILNITDEADVRNVAKREAAQRQAAEADKAALEDFDAAIEAEVGDARPYKLGTYGGKTADDVWNDAKTLFKHKEAGADGKKVWDGKTYRLNHQDGTKHLITNDAYGDLEELRGKIGARATENGWVKPNTKPGTSLKGGAVGKDGTPLASGYGQAREIINRSVSKGVGERGMLNAIKREMGSNANIDDILEAATRSYRAAKTGGKIAEHAAAFLKTLGDGKAATGERALDSLMDYAKTAGLTKDETAALADAVAVDIKLGGGAMQSTLPTRITAAYGAEPVSKVTPAATTTGKLSSKVSSLLGKSKSFYVAAKKDNVTFRFDGKPDVKLLAAKGEVSKEDVAELRRLAEEMKRAAADGTTKAAEELSTGTQKAIGDAAPAPEVAEAPVVVPDIPVEGKAADAVTDKVAAGDYTGIKNLSIDDRGIVEYKMGNKKVSRKISELPRNVQEDLRKMVRGEALTQAAETAQAGRASKTVVHRPANVDEATWNATVLKQAQTGTVESAKINGTNGAGWRIRYSDDATEVYPRSELTPETDAALKAIRDNKATAKDIVDAGKPTPPEATEIPKVEEPATAATEAPKKEKAPKRTAEEKQAYKDEIARRWEAAKADGVKRTSEENKALYAQIQEDVKAGRASTGAAPAAAPEEAIKNDIMAAGKPAEPAAYTPTKLADATDPEFTARRNAAIEAKEAELGRAMTRDEIRALNKDVSAQLHAEKAAARKEAKLQEQHATGGSDLGTNKPDKAMPAEEVANAVATMRRAAKASPIGSKAPDVIYGGGPVRRGLPGAADEAPSPFKDAVDANFTEVPEGAAKVGPATSNVGIGAVQPAAEASSNVGTTAASKMGWKKKLGIGAGIGGAAFLGMNLMSGMHGGGSEAAPEDEAWGPVDITQEGGEQVDYLGMGDTGGGGYSGGGGGGGYAAAPVGDLQYPGDAAMGDWLAGQGYYGQTGYDQQGGGGSWGGGESTPTTFYLPDENGQPIMDQPYEAVIINGESYYDAGDGTYQRVPDGAIVVAGGNGPNSGPESTGSGMWQMQNGQGVRYDPNNPYIPTQEEVMTEDVQAAIEENGGYSLENIMEAYQPYLETQYEMIDAQTEEQIQQMREQMAARGMYDSDIAMTMEQQIRDDADAQKDSLYQQILTEAYNTSLEYQYKYDQLALQQDQMDQSQDQWEQEFELAKQQFEAETGIKWAELTQNQQQLLFDEWYKTSGLNIDKYNAQTSRINATTGGSSGSSGSKPNYSGMADLEAKLAGMVQQGAGRDQIIAYARGYLNYGLSAANINAVLNNVINARNNGLYPTAQQ